MIDDPIGQAIAGRVLRQSRAGVLRKAGRLGSGKQADSAAETSAGGRGGAGRCEQSSVTANDPGVAMKQLHNVR